MVADQCFIPAVDLAESRVVFHDHPLRICPHERQIQFLAEFSNGTRGPGAAHDFFKQEIPTLVVVLLLENHSCQTVRSCGWFCLLLACSSLIKH